MRSFDDFLLKIPKKDIWRTLKESGLPVVLYGMGDGADKIIKVLDSNCIEISDIFASDEFVRGHRFHEHKVMKYSDIVEKYNKANILLCFAAKTDELFERFNSISEKYNFYAPDVPVFGNNIFTLQYFQDNIDNFRCAYELFADDESKFVFEQLILYKLTGKIEYIYNADSDKKSTYAKVLKLNNSENYLDLGAYIGDTVEEFTNTVGKYSSIMAVEPDVRSFNKLNKYIGEHSLNAVALNCGISDISEYKLFSNKAGRMSSVGAKKGVETKFCSIDEICKEQNFIPTYIKMDLEGEEAKALIGGKNTLTYKPKLLVSAYHRTEDIFKLPLLLNEINPNYKIYLRKHRYIPAWDINIYAI